MVTRSRYRVTWPVSLQEVEEAIRATGADVLRVKYRGRHGSTDRWPVVHGRWDRNTAQVWVYDSPPQLRGEVRRLTLDQALPGVVAWFEDGFARGDGWRLLEHGIWWHWSSGGLVREEEPPRDHAR